MNMYFIKRDFIHIVQETIKLRIINTNIRLFHDVNSTSAKYRVKQDIRIDLISTQKATGL